MQFTFNYSVHKGVILKETTRRPSLAKQEPVEPVKELDRWLVRSGLVIESNLAMSHAGIYADFN
jgi:hypothetical protein